MSINNNIRLAIIVAALGYTIDIFDAYLLMVYRVPSLKELGLNEEQITSIGLKLLNSQLIGMLIGGILWGIIGDKFGRVKVLFGSIITYSLATGLNAFVVDIHSYQLCRIISGIGLAGEVGAGITLVAELMPKDKRGIGITIIATAGVLGATMASVIGSYLDWRSGYFLGGSLGIVLLLLRLKVHESGLFNNLIASTNIPRGQIKMLFTKKRFFKYLNCILMGFPIFVVVTLIVTLSPEFGRALNLTDKIDVTKVVLFYSLGFGLGDITAGTLSQYLRSRKQVLYFYQVCLFLVFLCSFLLIGKNSTAYYWFTGFCGLAMGYWAILLMTSAEQFGTNLRATVATSVPNMCRGSAVLVTMFFAFMKGYFGFYTAFLITAVFFFIIAITATYKLQESFTKDLNYLEE